MPRVAAPRAPLAEVVADGADDADLSKNDAASAKCVAAPPSMRSRSPNGVLTASKAIEPTTVTAIG